MVSFGYHHQKSVTAVRSHFLNGKQENVEIQKPLMLVEVLVTAEIKFPFRSYVNVFAAALFVTTTWYCCGGISNPAHNISMAHSRSNDGIVAWAVSRLGTAVAVEEEHWLLSGRERCWLRYRRAKSSALGAS